MKIKQMDIQIEFRSENLLKNEHWNDNVIQPLSSLYHHHLLSIWFLHISMRRALSSLLLLLSRTFSDFYYWAPVEAWMSNIIWQHWCLSGLWQQRKGPRRRQGRAAKMQLAKNANVNQRQEMNSEYTQLSSDQSGSTIDIKHFYDLLIEKSRFWSHIKEKKRVSETWC